MRRRSIVGVVDAFTLLALAGKAKLAVESVALGAPLVIDTLAFLALAASAQLAVGTIALGALFDVIYTLAFLALAVEAKFAVKSVALRTCLVFYASAARLAAIALAWVTGAAFVAAGAV